ncbi:hypothetical protein GCM10027614_06710 [Micromonospora vulcania]
MTDLITMIWGDEPPISAVNVIHKYVGALRRLLEPELALRSSGSYLLRHGNGYRLMIGPEILDLAAFRHGVAAAKVSVVAERPEEAARAATPTPYGSATDPRAAPWPTA